VNAIIVSDGTDRPDWLSARAEGVSASEAHAIAAGGRSTWRRILEDKLNGESFKGNAETDRGRRREPYLLAYAAEYLANVEPSSALYARPEHPLHRATPDGIGTVEVDGIEVPCGVEAKSHAFGWDSEDVPIDHYDQMQFGMHVLGYARWLYVWEVMGEDGEPTLDEPRHLWIERDDRRIAQLVREVDAFIAWREAGAPPADDIDAALDDALAAWADARERKTAAESDEKGATTTVRAHIASTEGGEEYGLKVAGRRAEFVYTVKSENVFDADAWQLGEPETYTRWSDLLAEAEAIASAAALTYYKPARSTRLNLYPVKESA